MHSFAALLLAIALAPQLPSQEAPRPASFRIDAGQRVVRVEDGREVELRCLEGRESGRIAALTGHPTGLTFVAAERGLFLASSDCDVLDRVDFAEGSPPGVPVGVAAADTERLWLLTDQTLCVVEVRQFFWRALGAESGLPSGPFLGLSRAADGSLELARPEGVHRFVPGQGPLPVAKVLGVNGARHAPGTVIPLASGAALELALSRAVEHRWRDAKRFPMRALDPRAPRIEGLAPGRQSLRIVAFDAELRRSPAVAIGVDVAYPRALDPRILPLAGAVALLVAIVAALAFAWRRAHSLASLWKGLLSALLGSMVVLQVLAVCFPHSHGWPLVGFTMYTTLARKHSLAFHQYFYGLRPDGSRVTLHPPGAAYGKYETERALQAFVHDEPGRRAQFLAQWNAGHPGNPLIGLVGVCERRRLCPEGPVDVPALVFFVHPPSVLDAPR